MILISTLRAGLENKLLYSVINYETVDVVENLWMAEISHEPEPNSIYISDKKGAESYLKAYQNSKYTIFVSATDWDRNIITPPNCNLIVSDLSLAELYNKLSFNLRRMRQIKNRIESIPAARDHIKRLLETAIKETGFYGQFVILSPAFQVTTTASNYHPDYSYLNELEQGKYLTNAQIEQCLGKMESEETHITISLNAFKPIERTIPIKDERVLGYLMIQGYNEGLALNETLDQLSKLLPVFLHADPEAVVNARANLTQIMEDVFLAQNDDLDYLRRRIAQTPEKLKSYISSILCSYDEDKVSGVKLLAALKPILGTENITIYDNKIVAWVSGDSHIFRPNIDMNKLESVLKKYDCWCMISNSARFIRGLRTLYLQSNEMLSVLPYMDFVLHGKRAAFFEDLSFYYMINTYYQVSRSKFGHDKLVYLAGPNLMEIIRYDKDHGTDLMRFIYEYTDCGGNINQTAEKLHMHRNSVRARLEKIKDLLGGADLQDSHTFEELRTSAMIMLYSQNVLRQKYRISLSEGEE